MPPLQKGDERLVWESLLSRDLQTKADKIRAIAKAGHSYAEISGILGIPYQHVWNVLGPKGAKRPKPVSAPSRKEFRSEPLLRAGFRYVGEWTLSDGGEISPPRASDEPGVYAFVLDDVVVYIGLASRGLQGRLAQYIKPGRTQSTNIRIKSLIRDSLAGKRHVGVVVATPEPLKWHGLPVSTAAGLEAGLIQTIQPKWNMRGGG